MPISEQIRHIVKSVHEDVFYVLDVKHPPNMAAVASVCNAVYDARHSRIHLPPTPAASDALSLHNDISIDTLRINIRNVVRDELDRRDRVPPSRSSCDQDIKHKSIIRHDVAATLPPYLTFAIQPSYLDVGNDSFDACECSNSPGCLPRHIYGTPSELRYLGACFQLFPSDRKSVV